MGGLVSVKISREVMEGGNGATIGSGITHSPLGEQNVCPAHAHG